MPAQLNAIERFLILTLNKGPAPMLDILGGFSFFAISTAVEMGLFDALEGEPRTLPELAAAIGGSERGTAVLVDVLETLGYVERQRNRVRNTAMTATWMVDTSPTSMSPAFRYYGALMRDMWPFLRESVVHDRAHINFYDWLREHPEMGEHYQEFMTTLARMTLPELKRKLDFGRGPRKVLDIGGGHGTYSIGLCEKHPDLSVTIFDSPYSRSAAEQNILAAGMQERITFVPGDYMVDDIGEGYDAVLLFNVLHEHTSEENAGLVRKAALALNEGSRLVVLDQLRDKKTTGLRAHAVRTYGLMFFHVLGGQSYAFEDIQGWLEASGVDRIHRMELYRSGSSLITCTRACSGQHER